MLDAAAQFMDGMKRVGSYITNPARCRILGSFEAFRIKYLEAVDAIVTGDGLASHSLYDQAILYGDLLERLRADARKDECREYLWEPILLVGTALSEDKPEAAIVTPWHPYRLAEAGAKAKRVAAAITRIVGPSGLNSASIRRFALGVIDGINLPWHPAVVVRSDGPSRHLFIETDTFCDFSLLLIRP